MNRAEAAIGELHLLDSLAARDSFLHRIHPVVKIVVTLYYILLLVSFDKYNLTGVLGMVLIPMLLLELSELPIGVVLRQLRVLLGLLLLTGLVNPWFDRTVIAQWGSIRLTGGMISCVTLYLKGAFALMASYILIASTGMENICYGLQKMHLPRVLITVIMLIYRYLILFLKEINNTMLAYSMRAPGQRGIHIRTWGSLVGAMLLRSVERSELVYQSMRLRGFDGEFRMAGSGWTKGLNVGIQNPESGTAESPTARSGADIGYLVGMILMITMLRMIPIFELAGKFIQ